MFFLHFLALNDLLNVRITPTTKLHVQNFIVSRGGARQISRCGRALHLEPHLVKEADLCSRATSPWPFRPIAVHLNNGLRFRPFSFVFRFDEPNYCCQRALAGRGGPISHRTVEIKYSK